MPRDPKDVAVNLLRFWQDDDVKALIAEIQEDIRDEWQGAKTKEKREELHGEIRTLTRFVARFKARCEHAEAPDTRKLRT